MTFYKEHRIFRHKGAVCLLYVCLENLTNGTFLVQQLEFFEAGNTREGEISKQTLELFAESDPAQRPDWHESLQKAIEAHDRDFENN